MYEQVEKTPVKKSQLEANGVSQRPNNNASTSRFVDNRPEAIQMQKLRDLAKDSPQNKKLRDLHHLAAAHSVVQKKSNVKKGIGFVDNRSDPVAQRKLQELANNSPQAKRATQLKAIVNNHSAQQQNPIQKKENNTGLPDNLKSGIENLSGYSMDDVKVHYNSGKPAQLQAHAYAQGTDIHLASGQEKHLPHEAWHVVQQKQGRVKPTIQMKGNVNVNDDAGLEKEADVMGQKALINSNAKQPTTGSLERNLLSNSPIQRKVGFEIETGIKLRKISDTQSKKSKKLTHTNYQHGIKIPITSNWYIESESGEGGTVIEFVSRAFSLQEKATAMLTVGNMAGLANLMKMTVDYDYLNKERPIYDYYYQEKEGSDYLEKELPSIALFTDSSDLKHKSARIMPSSPKSFNGAIQVTGGVKLENITSLLGNVNKTLTKYDVPESNSKAALINKEEDRATLKSASGLSSKYIKELVESGSCTESEVKKLEGLLSLFLSYVQSIEKYKGKGKSLLKYIFPVLHKTNFSSMYRSLSEKEQNLFDIDRISRILNFNKESSLLTQEWKANPKSKMLFKTNITLNSWVESIKKGENDLMSYDKDAVSRQGKGEEVDNPASKSMGMFKEMDGSSLSPLAVLELRRIQNPIPHKASTSSKAIANPSKYLPQIPWSVGMTDP